MTCVAELHGSVTRMVYSILSLIGSGDGAGGSPKEEEDVAERPVASESS